MPPKTKEVKEKKKEVKEKKKEVKEKKKEVKELTDDEKLIEQIKEKYKNAKFYCVGERKKDVCVECILSVDISRNPYRIIGNCVSCKKPISKFISSKLN